jgi:hypothetical protein
VQVHGVTVVIAIPGVVVVNVVIAAPGVVVVGVISVAAVQ